MKSKWGTSMIQSSSVYQVRGYPEIVRNENLQSLMGVNSENGFFETCFFARGEKNLIARHLGGEGMSLVPWSPVY